MTSPELPKRIRTEVESRRPELISLLRQLVRTPSQTGDEGEIQAFVADEMTRRGLQVDTWTPSVEELQPWSEHVGEFESLEGRPNVVGTWNGSGDGKSLILNAHIDTVEPGDPSLWTYPPFSGELVDGKVHGRGACDMKAGLVTHLIALDALRALGYSPTGTIHVESVISEEDGGAGALASILRGYKADAAVITEPTDLSVIVAHGGSLVFRLHVRGKSAHAAVRNEGVSALEKYMVLHQAMTEFEAERNASIDHPLYTEIANKIPINVGIVRSGSWPSSVPEWLIAEGRAGLVPGEDLATFKAEFVAMIVAAAQEDDWLREHPPEVEWFSGQFAPSEEQQPSALIDALVNAHTANTGRQPKIEAATYGADMRHYILHGGIPCVMYGAGNAKVAHHTDEHVQIDDVITATTTIALLMADWCGGTFEWELD